MLIRYGGSSPRKCNNFALGTKTINTIRIGKLNEHNARAVPEDLYICYFDVINTPQIDCTVKILLLHVIRPSILSSP